MFITVILEEGAYDDVRDFQSLNLGIAYITSVDICDGLGSQNGEM
jgi:hypothetical protein